METMEHLAKGQLHRLWVQYFWLQEELLSAERLDSEDGGSGGAAGCGSRSSATDPDGERPQSEGKSSPSAGSSRLREQEGDEAQLSPSAVM